MLLLNLKRCPNPSQPAKLPTEREQAEVQQDGQGYAQDHAHHYPEQAAWADTTQSNPPPVRLGSLLTRPAGSASIGSRPAHLPTKAGKGETPKEASSRRGWFGPLNPEHREAQGNSSGEYHAPANHAGEHRRISKVVANLADEPQRNRSRLRECWYGEEGYAGAGTIPNRLQAHLVAPGGPTARRSVRELDGEGEERDGRWTLAGGETWCPCRRC